MAATDVTPDTRAGDDPTPTSAPTPTTPRRGDPAPKRRGGARPGAGRPKGSKTGAKRKTSSTTATAAAKSKTSEAQDDAKLNANLKMLLELPVIPARQVGFAFAVAHFSEASAPTADLIVRASKTWPELRHTLLNADNLVSGKVLFAVAIAAYIAPVAAYMIGQESLAYTIGKATPQQVGAIEQMLALPPELAEQLRQAQANGASPAVLQRMVESFYASQAAFDQSTPKGGGPTAAGAPPAATSAPTG